MKKQMMNKFGWPDDKFSLNHIRLEALKGHSFRKFDNAIGISEFKILGVEPSRIMESSNLKSMAGSSGVEEKVIGNKKVKFFSAKWPRGKGWAREKTDKKKFFACFPIPGIFQLLLQNYGGNYERNIITH